MESLNYENKNIERRYLKYMPKKQFSKVKNKHLELQKDFIKLKDRELKDREVKIKREKNLLLSDYCLYRRYGKVSKKNEKKNKLRSIKNTRFCWLINYIPEPIRKSVGGFKNKVFSLFNTKYT